MIGRALTITAMVVLAAAVGPADAGDASLGAKLNVERCAKCHGQGGKGDGAGLKNLDVDVKPVDWTSKAGMAKWTDQEINRIIREGGKAVGKSKVMPAYRGKLSEADIANLVTYIRSLAK